VHIRAACERLDNHREELGLVKGEILWTSEEDEALLAMVKESFPLFFFAVFAFGFRFSGSVGVCIADESPRLSIKRVVGEGVTARF